MLCFFFLIIMVIVGFGLLSYQIRVLFNCYQNNIISLEKFKMSGISRTFQFQMLLLLIDYHHERTNARDKRLLSNLLPKNTHKHARCMQRSHAFEIDVGLKIETHLKCAIESHARTDDRAHFTAHR